LEKRPTLDQPEKQGADQDHHQEHAAKGPEICVMNQRLDNVVSKLEQKQE
jgi:hypothetical protein